MDRSQKCTFRETSASMDMYLRDVLLTGRKSVESKSMPPPSAEAKAAGRLRTPLSSVPFDHSS
jgi:hypothetical protein